jgi:outer membrane protein TolC
MLRSLTALILAVAAGSPLLAAPLTLGDAIDAALAANPAVLAAAERSAAAHARERQARGHRLPKLDLSESFSRTDNPAEVFALQLNQERFDFNDFVQADPNRPDPLETWTTRLELELPLYTGGKLSARIDQAELMASAGELEAEHARQRTVFDTVVAYVQLAQAREQLDLMEKARDTTRAHLERARHFAEQGMILSAEVLQAEVYLAEREEAVARARTGADLAEAALNFQMGAPQEGGVELAPLAETPPVKGDLGSWIELAVEERHDLLAARRKRDAGQQEEQVARSEFLPEVAVVGHYDLYDDTVFGSHGSSGSLMAVARINLFKGGSRLGALAASRHDTAAFDHDLDRFEEGVRLEVRQAWQNLVTARARHDTASSSLAAAREALRVRETRFGQGLDAMIDLLDAETALREAELREMVARYDVIVGSYRVLFATGQPLVDDMEESR